MSLTDEAVATAYVAHLREELQRARDKILHCLQQLDEEDIWWRPAEEQNSIQNILLHVCGSFRQWVIAGLGSAPDVRNRPAEFAERRPIPKAELAELLTRTVAEGDAVLAQLDSARLLEERRIQGFDTNVLGAAFDAVSHVIGHACQVMYITRMRRNEAYRFFWVPQMPEQISAR
jgi:uncharacterized damage-inducible protein DinB